MRRVDLFDSADSQDNLLVHLTRYKFISRLVKKDDKLLEIGCGTGYGSRFLCDYVSEVYGSDTDEEVRRYAEQKYIKSNLKFVGDSEPYAPFDVVVCLEVIEHCTVEDGLRLLKDIRRVLAQDGVAFISTPRKVQSASQNRKRHHIHEYEYEEFRNTLESVFGRALVFTQVDEIISTHHSNCAWNFIACCTK